MIRLSLLLLVTSLMLSGCQNTYKKPPINEPSTDATIQLAEAAVSISDSMYEMAQVEKNIFPHAKTNKKAIPNIPPLQVRASADWAGPIEEVTARVAKAAHYHFRAVGKQPAIPILVNLAVKDDTLVQILRNLDYQAAQKASIHVYPKRRMVELHYAKFYG